MSGTDLEYSLEEVELLRQGIIQACGYSQTFLGAGSVSTTEKFYSLITGSHHTFSILKEEFKSLPLLLYKYNAKLDPRWHKAIITWRLKIGK